MKNGDMVMCGINEDSLHHGPYRFIGYDHAGHVVVDCDGSPEVYFAAKKVIPKAYKEFTKKTFPKGVVWIRRDGDDEEEGIVGSVTKDSISADGFNMQYDVLLEFYEMSLDGRITWQKAGVEI